MPERQQRERQPREETKHGWDREKKWERKTRTNERHNWLHTSRGDSSGRRAWISKRRAKDAGERGTCKIWLHFSGGTFQSDIERQGPRRERNQIDVVLLFGQIIPEWEQETKTQQERQGPARVGRTRERVKVPVEIGTRQRDSDRKGYLYFVAEAPMQRNNVIWQREVNEKTTTLTINKYTRERRNQQVQ